MDNIVDQTKRGRSTRQNDVKSTKSWTLWYDWVGSTFLHAIRVILTTLKNWKICQLSTVFTACVSGYYGDGSTCTACPAETYSVTWNASVAMSADCNNCSTGYTTLGATAQTSCSGQTLLPTPWSLLPTPALCSCSLLLLLAPYLCWLLQWSYWLHNCGGCKDIMLRCGSAPCSPLSAPSSCCPLHAPRLQRKNAGEDNPIQFHWVLSKFLLGQT